jgi:hypothetical protein
MDISITFQEKNSFANYSVEQETPITYNLRLISFESEKNLPTYLKIHRSDNGWISAFQDQEMVNALGAAIEHSNVNQK